MANIKHKYPWQEKISNHSQIGGIETSVLDNGTGRGVRIAWVNTGTPLRYKLVIDRGLDIADAFYAQHSLAWLSHTGVTSAQPCSDRGVEWLYSFGGGLLTTCGLSHIGGPEQDENGTRGLHGRYSNIVAEVESIIQPDPANGKLDMEITASVVESKVFGPSLKLRRRISGRLGEPKILISDTVTNIGNSSVPHMLLYHINFGWPLVDDNVDIVYRGTCKSLGRGMDDELFNDNHDYRKCQKPLDSHKAGCESCGFIDVEADDGICTAGIVNRRLSLAAIMRFHKSQLPCLTNWQHWGPCEYVCALEPGTNFPIGQKRARQQNELIMLEPGRSRSYDLELKVLSASADIEEFIAKWG